MKVTRFFLSLMACVLLLCLVFALLLTLMGHAQSGNKELTFASRGCQNAGCNWKIYAMDVEHRIIVPFRDAPSSTSMFDFAWSPDGQEMVYSIPSMSLPPVSTIDIFNLEGAVSRHLINGIDQPFSDPREFAWSPDSTQIAFTARDSAQISQIYLVNADGSATQQITADGGRYPAWTNGGRSLIFSCFPPDGFQICSIALDDGVMSNITRGMEASVSPDGEQIALMRMQASSQVNISFGDIFIVNIDGSHQRTLTETLDDDESAPTWSLDGTQIAFIRMGDIYLMNADGSDVQRLTHTSRGYRNLAWRP